MPSGGEWAILVLIALLLIGGAWLPGIGSTASRSVREVRDSTVEPDASAPVGLVAASPAEPERS